ncbi:MAG: ABC transporter substrate-binding protein [Lachnospiraceae bacterium]|nr:ABC transporter substrate-binding protein [Lachnospiraceae bacterium]
MKKRILALTMAMVMVAGSMVACGKETTPETTPDGGDATVVDDGETTTPDGGDTTVVEKPEEDLTAVDAAKMEVPDTSAWTDADKIYVYSWNDEFGNRLARVTGSEIYGVNPGDKDDNGNDIYVEGAYPELAQFVEYINLGCSGTDGTYQQKLDAAWGTAEHPSLIACDNDVAKYFTESDMTLNLYDLGITDDMYANSYDFAVQYAKYGDELKALTWQAPAGNISYRADIAEEVLGVSEPDDVQAFVKDWDTFFDTADKMKEAGYAMVSSYDEIKYACWDQQTQPWVKVDADGSETLQLDSAVEMYFEYAKKLADGGYIQNVDATMWSDGWNANYDGDVFCYFGCTWAVYWCLKADATYGDWRVTEGPVGYHWGGTYVAVTDGCPNTELAAFLAYSLCCDEDIMYRIAVETKDFVNNKAAIAKEVANGDGADALLGGQNPVATWAESAKKINLSNACYLDSEIKTMIDSAAKLLIAGDVDVAGAIENVKSQVAEKYDYITVE